MRNTLASGWYVLVIALSAVLDVELMHSNYRLYIPVIM